MDFCEGNPQVNWLVPKIRGMVGCTPGPTYPVMGNSYISPIEWV